MKQRKTPTVADGNGRQAKRERRLERKRKESIFDASFSREILKSERLRVIILMTVGLVIALWFCVPALVFPERLPPDAMKMYRGLPMFLWIALVFLAFALYELMMIAVFTRCIRRNRRPMGHMRYVNTTIEVSVPTAAMYLASFVFVPYQTIFSPMVFVYFIFIALTALRLNFTVCLFTGAVACIEYIFLAVDLIGRSGQQHGSALMLGLGWHAGKALLLLLAGLTTGFVAMQIKRRVSDSIRNMQEMTESFSRFVPREFLHFLNRDNIVQVRLGDQVMREMTVLFSDIRSFTRLSEQMTPQENIDFINGYLTAIGPVIRKHGGFIDKYIGDAIMALFPDSADSALDAALGMFERLALFNRERAEAGKDPVDIGIGIHTGSLMLGTVGEHNRLDTTVISDAVNIAARLEGLNKEFHTRIIISAASRNRLEHPDRYSLREIGEVSLKGRDRAIAVLEVVAGGSSAIGSDTR